MGESGGLMSDYWRKFWDEHAKASRDMNPQLQVLRTWQKQPVEDKIFQEILETIQCALELSSEHVLLDLCCGNGLITKKLSPLCKEITGVDFTAELIEHIDVKAYPNVRPIVSDILSCDFAPCSFDNVLIYSSIQYFTQPETVRLFELIWRWLKPLGRLFLGDIPDQRRIWNFFNNVERESVYFEHLRDQQPIIGTWYDFAWLEKLSRHAGFRQTLQINQPPHFPFSHFRFDALFCKSEEEAVDG
jgi:SAM-dependent methyltransferase